MSARSELQADDKPTPSPPDAPTASGTPPSRLIAAIAIGAVGAVLVGLAPVIGMVKPAMPAAFASWPLLLPLAILPPAGAAWAVRRGRSALGAALLLGPAVLAPGRLVLDGQLVFDAGLAARPELLLPDTLDPLIPSVGLWLLLVGHVLTAIAGGLASTSVSRDPDPSLGAAFGDIEDIPAGGARRHGLLTVVLCAAVVAAVGLLMTQFRSGDPYLLPRAALDSPPAVLIGSLVLAIGVLVAGGFAAGSADLQFARGGLLGLGAALAGIVVPPLFAVAVLADLHLASGSVLGLIGAAGLVASAISAGRVPAREPAGELRLPALTRLLAAAGALGLIAGLLALVAAMLPQWQMPAGFAGEPPYPARLLWPSGGLVAALGAATLWPRTALRARPALAVVWVAIPLAGTATLDTVFTAARSAGAQAGTGAWVAGAAIVLAVIAGLLAAIAGGVERDDVDLTTTTADRTVAVPALIAAALVIAAFSLPVVTAPDYVPPGVFTGFGTTSWGLVCAMVVVAGVAATAPLCRPERATALLAGAAGVVLVRVLEMPLTAERAEGAGPGWGVWSGSAALLVLLVAAAVAASRARHRESE
ncbi:hypothetical protein [Parasphingorhabdus pacifica]